MSIRILNCDVLDGLAQLIDESVHCVVTSPPYWGLRDYGVDGQIGLEATPAEFVARMVDVFREVRRVLRKDGTCWMNLGDSYAGSWGAQSRGDEYPGGLEGTSPIQARSIKASLRDATGTGSLKRTPGLKSKDLIGIPWRVALALQDDGWWLRQDIIWSKPNPMPESIQDRCTKAHEYIFLLTKSERYAYDADAIREAWTSGRDDMRENGLRTDEAYVNQAGPQSNSKKRVKVPGGWDRGEGAHGTIHRSGRTSAEYQEADTKAGRNKRSVWTIATAPFPEAHFATFPPELPEICIKAGCPKCTCGACGTVLDSRYETARSSTNGKAVQDLQVVRPEGGAGSPQPGSQLLQQSLRVPVDCQKSVDDEGVHHHVARVSDAAQAGASECDPLRVRDGASPRNGSGAKSAAASNGGRASQGRKSAQQRPEQFGSADEAEARQAAEAQDGHNPLPPLRREDHDLSVCPSCGASLDEVGTKPGVVLDCFGGAGTTGLVADRLQRNAILIELNPEYAAMARRRIDSDRGGLLDAMESHP